MASNPSPSADQTEMLSSGLAGSWWLVALRGLAAIVFGMIAFWSPAATMLALALIFAAYSLVDGIFNVVLAMRGMRHRRGRWGWFLANGLLGIAVAVAVVLWPGLTVLVFVLIFAAWALFSGGMLLAAAVKLKKTHGRWWMVLGALLSIACGVLLFVAPLIGAIVLTWWLGAYALVFGIALLALAFQLRKRRDDSHPPAAMASAHS